MINSIELLVRDLRRRFWSPVRSVTFYAHLFVTVIFGGGLGIWYELYRCYHHDQWSKIPISAALFTYFPAVVAAAVVELIHEGQPYLRSFGYTMAALFLGIFAFAVTTSPSPQLFWAIIGSVLAVFFWWVTNGEKECFRDINPSAATPGPNVPMSGNHNNWQT
jgi:hypothetical protein